MRKALLFMTMAIAVRTYAADPHCTADDTLQTCFNKFKHPTTIAAAEAVTWTPKAQATVAAKNTGVSSLAVPTQSTTKDFLSMLAAALAVPMTGTGARPLTLETNFPFAMLGGDEQRIKLQAVLVRPELSSEMKTRLASNAAAMATLKDSMSELDDVTVSLSVDPSAQHLGRSITPHTEAYRSMLAAWAATGAMDTALDAFSLQNNINRTIALKSINPAASNDFVADAEAAAHKAGGESVTNFADGFARLLNNQPQIFGSVLYHTRKNLAGPKERAARLTYEKGFHNLNAFYAGHRNCSQKDANAECAKELLAFAGDKKDDDPADRMAFSIEYRGSSDLLVSLPNPIVNFKASRAHTFVYSAGYGRKGITKEGRIDVAINYEDTTLSNAVDLVTPTRAGRASAALTTASKAVHDRFVASATYTYKINGMMAMPLSLIYANHASFLGDVGRKLNAHFGITMKLPTP